MSELRFIERADGTKRLQSLVRGVWADVPCVLDKRPVDPLVAAMAELKAARAENLELRTRLDAYDALPDAT